MQGSRGDRSLDGTLCDDQILLELDEQCYHGVDGFVGQLDSGLPHPVLEHEVGLPWFRGPCRDVASVVNDGLVTVWFFDHRTTSGANVIRSLSFSVHRAPLALCRKWAREAL